MDDGAEVGSTMEDFPETPGVETTGSSIPGAEEAGEDRYQDRTDSEDQSAPVQRA